VSTERESHGTDAPPSGPERDRPPLLLRLLGQAVSVAIARVPGSWPLLRRATRRFWDRNAAHWDERIKPERPEHLAPLAAACDRLDRQPDAILELGTGTGAGALLLAGRFPDAEVHAVDISEAMVAAAGAKLPAELADRVHFTVADASSLPYEDGRFDLVVQLNMPTYFDEVARVLQPGGHVIVASSLGAATPYYTPERLLLRRFSQRGLDAIAAGAAGVGTYFLARRRGTGDDVNKSRDSLDDTVAVRGFYDKTARRYNRQISLFERVLFGGGREWVCSQAHGDVLEIAAGTGRNLRHYPPSVRLTAIELSPEMLEIARQEAGALGRDADLRVGDAQALEFPDDTFDTVVCTLGLCTIPDDRAAVREAKRVLRPGGLFALLEHVRSPLRVVRTGERLLEPIMLRFEHDHLTREPLEHLRAEGFEIERVERSKLGIVERVAARKPAST
jgi:ubiquinone/menaquinone biosynthesis C-methylase UbiE